MVHCCHFLSLPTRAPPSRASLPPTPLQAGGKAVEVVFVSADRDEAEFKDYYGSMPWLALPLEDKARNSELNM